MKTLFRIIKGIITVFLCVVLLLVIFQKFTKNRVALGNIYIFQVVSESMIPEYKIGDIIVTKKTNPVSLKVGDDVTDKTKIHFTWNIGNDKEADASDVLNITYVITNADGT